MKRRAAAIQTCQRGGRQMRRYAERIRSMCRRGIICQAFCGHVVKYAARHGPANYVQTILETGENRVRRVICQQRLQHDVALALLIFVIRRNVHAARGTLNVGGVGGARAHDNGTTMRPTHASRMR